MMDGLDGSQGFAERMNLLYSSSFKYPDIELKKSSGFMDSNNSLLTRYRSAPSSFLEGLNNGAAATAAGYDDFQYDRTSSPEIDNFVAKYMLCSTGSSDVQGFGDGKCVKREEEEPVAVTQFGGYSNASQVLYRRLSNDDSTSVGNNNKNLRNSFGRVCSMGLESSIQPEMNRNGCGLARQCSSPADLFSKISSETGSTLIRDANGFRSSTGVNSDASPSSSPLYGRINLASGASPRSRPTLPRIAELENELIGLSGPEDENLSYMSEGKRHFISNFGGDSSWPNSPVKRARESEGNMFPALNRLPAQVDSRERCSTLTHHLSLPKSFAEMASAEKLMQFQGSIPCKIRAKRGCATHPRSIAERVRRTRISERMRKLQDLFPNLDKQTNTADMLEMAVEYIKDLQKQVKTLSDAKAKCTCTSIDNQYSKSNLSS